MSLHMDESQLNEYCKRHGMRNPLGDMPKTSRPKKTGSSKYGNVKTTVDGIPFDSRREAERYAELKMMKAAREVVQICLQVPFDLPGGIRYVADFVVLHRDGTWTVEDAKGIRTAVYIMKEKLMREYWGIKITEV